MPIARRGPQPPLCPPDPNGSNFSIASLLFRLNSVHDVRKSHPLACTIGSFVCARLLASC